MGRYLTETIPKYGGHMRRRKPRENGGGKGDGGLGGGLFSCLCQFRIRSDACTSDALTSFAGVEGSVTAAAPALRSMLGWARLGCKQMQEAIRNSATYSPLARYIRKIAKHSKNDIKKQQNQTKSEQAKNTKNNQRKRGKNTQVLK